MLNKASTISVICWVIIAFCDAATANVPCETPTGTRGKCVPVPSCSSLYQLVLKPDLSEENITYLRKSQCGYLAKVPYVCCEDKTEVRAGIIPLTGTLPTPPACGLQMSDRITMGTITEFDEFPWMALLEYTKGTGKSGFHCGGSLINERYVVTAAHCVSKSTIPSDWTLTSVRLGEWNITSNKDCITDNRGNEECAPVPKDIAVEEQIIHPDYDPKRQYNDIALLRLAEDVVYTDYIKPICLPLNDSLRNVRFEYRTYERAMDIAGWGYTEEGLASSVKLKATVYVKNFNDCKAKYQRVGRIQLNEGQLCAGSTNGADTCKGDSGGPLMVQENVPSGSYYFLAGVTSFGTKPCGLENFPAVYTRVGAYMDWILNTIRP